MKPEFTYKGGIVRVIDGDTYEVMIDLGFKVCCAQTIRLEGVDTPELKSKDPFEKAYAEMVRERVEEFILEKDIVIKTKYDKTFARYVASVFLPQYGMDLATWIRINRYTKADIPRGI